MLQLFLEKKKVIGQAFLSVLNATAECGNRGRKELILPTFHSFGKILGRLLEDPVKIYLAATCHSKSAPATVQEIMILAAWVLVSFTRECHILVPSKN